MSQLDMDLTKAVRSAVDRINEITGEVAVANSQIVGIEANCSANDLRDKRNMLVSELAEYLDINTFEQSNGSLTIVTAKGCVLAQGDSGYDLAMGGAAGDRIMWLGSGGTNVDLSNYLNQGKLGGWFTMRDETLAKYGLDLDSFVNEFIWSVNQQHSQGVGTKLFEPGTTLTGTYQTGTDLGDLQFGNEIQFVADAFKLWIEDRSNPNSPVMNSVSIDLSGLDSSSTLSDLATAVNNQIAAEGLTGVTADGSGAALSFTSGSDYAFGFSDDVSYLQAALGVNTFFQGVDATTIGMNSIISDKDYIAASRIDSGGNYTAGDNTNARAMADLQIATADISLWTCDRIAGNSAGSVTTTLEDYYHTMVGSIGTTASSFIRSRTFSESMVDRLKELRDSVSAVSLDEEMTNLIQYQHAFAAASKLVNTSDKMMETLLSLK
jgi:flagellar hook-associated protein 1 FlgK